MSNHANVLLQHTPVTPGNIRYLALRSGGSQPAAKPRSKMALLALVLTVVAHAAVFSYVLTHQVEIAQMVEVKPMMVSLLPSPPAEIVQIVPVIPKPPTPKPIIRKQEIKPEIKPDIKPDPTPQPVQAVEPVTPPPVVATKAIQTEQTVEKAVEPPPVVEKPEPKIEPPRFGVSYLNNPPPAYPPISRRLGEKGRVMLKVLVNARGDAESVDLDTSSGSERLDRAAIEAVKKWRFVPAKRDGQPLSAIVLVPLVFELKQS